MPNQLQRLIGKKIPLAKLQEAIKHKKSTDTLTEQELDLALRTAARIGTREQLQEIVSAGAKLDAQGLDRNLLDLTLSNTDTEVVRRAASMRSGFNDGSTHFHNLMGIAMSGGTPEIVDAHMKLNPIVTQTPSQTGRTLLFYAAAMGQRQVVDSLTKSGVLIRQINETPSQFQQTVMYEFGSYIYFLRDHQNFAEQQFNLVSKYFDELINLIKENNYSDVHERKRELVKAYRQKASLYSFRGEYHLNHAQNLLDGVLDNKEKCDKANKISEQAKKDFQEALAILEKIPGECLTEIDRINNRTISRFIRDNLCTAYYCWGIGTEVPTCFSLAIEEVTRHVDEVDNETIVEFLAQSKKMYESYPSGKNEADFCDKLLKIFVPHPGVSLERAPELYAQFIKTATKCNMEGWADFVSTVLKFIYKEFQHNKLPSQCLKSQLQVPENLKRLVELIKKHDPKFQETKSEVEELKFEKEKLLNRVKALECTLRDQVRALEAVTNSAKDKLDVLDNEKPAQQQASASYPGFHALPSVPRP